MQRVLTAAIGAPLALVALFLLPRVGFLALVLGLCLIAAIELARLGVVLGAGRAVWSLPVLTLLAALLLTEPAVAGVAEIGADTRFLLVLVLATFASAIVALWSRGSVRERAMGIWLIAFGALYLALPVSAIDRLRGRDPFLVVFLLAVVWLTDTGAFLVGGKWGKRKLAPQVSPNKTWEGALGGLVAGVAAAGAWSLWRLGAVEPGLLLAGGLVSTAGQIGDLIESLIKRAAGVKDSGALLPGHGGMLDRPDSLFVAAPVLELVCRLTPWAEH